MQNICTILSALEPIADDEGGEFYEMFLDWNAEKYSKRLSKRVKDGLDISVQNGTFCGGWLIFGYKIDLEPINGKPNKFIKRVVIDEEPAKIVEYVFTEYSKGVTKKEIAEQLNKQGFRRDGKTFTGKSFDYILRNRKYTGEFTFGGRESKNMYPPIISTAIYDKVQKILNSNKYVAGGKTYSKVPYLLTGKLYCGICGTPMVADGGTGRLGNHYNYYSCKKKRKSSCTKARENKDNLEYIIVTYVINYLKIKENTDKIITHVLDFYDKRTDEQNLKSINAKIASVKKEIEQISDSFIKAKNDLIRNAIELKANECEILLNDLETQKVKLELENGYKPTKEDISTFINEFINGDILDKQYQKKLIDLLIYKAYVYDNEILVYLNFNLGSNEIIPISFEETNDIVNNCSNVLQQSASSRQEEPNPNPIGLYRFFFHFKFYRALASHLFQDKHTPNSHACIFFQTLPKHIFVENITMVSFSC